MAEQLYRIVDEFPFQEKLTTYHGLTLEQAATRMDDLIGVGERTILEDWKEDCPTCKGSGAELRQGFGEWLSGACPNCDGEGTWPGPWEHTDDETGREVTMTRVADPPPKGRP